MELEFVNQALVHDEVLLSVSQVLDLGWPAGPVFLHSLSTLIEAVVLYDTVYFDPANQLYQAGEPDSLPTLLANSEFVGTLMREGAIAPMPLMDDMDKFFKENGRDYDSTDFIVDALYDLRTYSYSDPGAEDGRMDLYTELLTDAPMLLRELSIAPEAQTGNEFLQPVPNMHAYLLANQLRLSRDDMEILEGYNRRAKAYFDLARNTGLHLQPFFLGLPHQLGAIKSNNSIAKATLKKIEAEVEKMDDFLDIEPSDEIGAFQRATIPLLVQTVLAGCNGSAKNLSSELLEIRYRHKDLRKTIAVAEQSWRNAKTRKERWQIRLDLDASIEKIVEREKHRSTRIAYWLWEVFSEPTKILKNLGDRLVKRGKDEQVIGRVGGLYDFWKDLRDAPPTEKSLADFRKTFTKLAPESVWSKSQKLTNAMNSYLGTVEE